MNGGIIISQHVVNTIKSLPAGEREQISKALMLDLVLGVDPSESLSPFQSMIYSIIKYYVQKDMERGANIAVS